MYAMVTLRVRLIYSEHHERTWSFIYTILRNAVNLSARCAHLNIAITRALYCFKCTIPVFEHQRLPSPESLGSGYVQSQEVIPSI